MPRLPPLPPGFPRNTVLYAPAENRSPVVTTYEPTAWWPSGSLALDWCFGGGLPQGRVTLIHGAESTGKTTLALLMCKAAVDRGGNVAYIDAEHALDP